MCVIHLGSYPKYGRLSNQPIVRSKGANVCFVTQFSLVSAQLHLSILIVNLAEVKHVQNRRDCQLAGFTYVICCKSLGSSCNSRILGTVQVPKRAIRPHSRIRIRRPTNSAVA